MNYPNLICRVLFFTKQLKSLTFFWQYYLIQLLTFCETHQLLADVEILYQLEP